MKEYDPLDCLIDQIGRHSAPGVCPVKAFYRRFMPETVVVTDQQLYDQFVNLFTTYSWLHADDILQRRTLSISTYPTTRKISVGNCGRCALISAAYLRWSILAVQVRLYFL